MSITCLKSGTLASIQDLGRNGYQKLGVIVSGAMDSHALKMANLVVGNEQSEACIEVTMRGSSFRFNQDTLIAITGGDLRPTIEGIEVPQWRPVLVKANSVLKFKGNIIGLRSYLAVSGGYIIEERLGSKSTYLRAEFGGYNGRPLQKDDVIDVNLPTSLGEDIQKNLVEKSPYFATVNWHVRTHFYEQNKEVQEIRFMEGNEYAWFTTDAKTHLETALFTVENSSDRMGYRLKGHTLSKVAEKEMISEAIINGTVQVSNDGNPIVLLADRQTTGGYPRIAQIISADLYKFGQLKPSDKIQFKKVDLQTAYDLIVKLEQELTMIKLQMKLKFG